MQKEATKAPEAPKAGVTPAPAKVPAPVEEKAVDPPLLDAPAKTAGKKMPWDKDEESESSDGEMDMGGSADWMDAMTPQEAKLQSWEKEVKKGESEA